MSNDAASFLDGTEAASAQQPITLADDFLDQAPAPPPDTSYGGILLGHARPAIDLAHNIATGAVRGGGNLLNMLGQEPDPFGFSGEGDRYAPGDTFKDLVFNNLMSPYQPREPIGGYLQGAAEGATSMPISPLAMMLGAASGGLSTYAADHTDNNPYWTTGAALAPYAIAPLAAAAGAPLVRAVASRVLPGGATAQAVARIGKTVSDGLTGGGRSVEDMLAQLETAKGDGTPLFLADVLHSPGKSLAGTVYRSGGQAETIADEALTARDAGAGPRIIGALENGLTGGDTTGAFTAGQQLQAAKKAAAAPAYNAFYNGAPPINPDMIAPGGELDELMKRPSMNTAGRNALALAREEGRDPASLGIGFDSDGNVQFQRVPSWQTLDYVKRGLDDVVNQYRNPLTGKLNLDTAGNAVNGTLQDYLKFLDRNSTVPDPTGLGGPDVSLYKQARAAYSGPAQSQRALDLGATIFSKAPDEIAHDIGGLSPGDQDFYRLGVMQKLRSGILDTSGNEARTIANKQGVQQRLQAVFPDQASWEKAFRTIQNENTAYNTQQGIKGNSASAYRLAADARENGGAPVLMPALMAAGAASTGELGFAASQGGAALRNFYANLGRSSPKVNAETARLLFSGDHEQNARTLQTILEASRNPSLAARLAGTTAAQAPQLFSRESSNQ